MATLKDLLASGMSRDEINALLSQSTVGTEGFDPSTFNSEKANPNAYMPPPQYEPGRGPAGMVEQAPLNMIRNNTTGRVFAPETMSGQPSQSQGGNSQSGYLQGRQVVDRRKLSDGRIVELVKVPTLDGFGRQTMSTREEITTPAYLDPASIAKQKYEGQAANIAHTQAQTAQTGMRPTTTPPGYRITQNGNLEAIPGGPADQKIAGQYNADIAQLQSSNSDLDRLSTSANELLKTSNLGRITGIVGALPNIPGMEGADAQAKLNTLKSQVGFGVLQAMRNASKTGGALGNVSDAEGKRLEANLAALENAQSEKQMRESLQKIVDFSSGAKDRLASAFNLRHNPENASTPIGSQGGGTGIGNQQKYSGAEIQAVALRTGKTEAQVREDMKAKGLL